jgi:nicotinate-nucleotide pyrophosphorylase (carboxylating)
MRSFELSSTMIDRAVDRALEEDLCAGDVTTEACIEPDAKATAHAIARRPMVPCGGAVFARVFARIDADLRVTLHARDGERVPAGARLWTVEGRARSILMGERVALNFVQRLSGIATAARAYVDAVAEGARTRITDTRKTTPGLRYLERYAVRTGGAHNHRDNLGSAVLIKDNHIAACGGVRQAIERARAFAPHTCKVECEVDTLEQLDEAFAAGADVLLLDNMDTPTILEAVRRVREAEGETRRPTWLEASGGITLARVPELSRAGVDAISVGALTHSPQAADIGLDFEG